MEKIKTIATPTLAYMFFIVAFFSIVFVQAQHKVNSDSLYYQSLAFYKNQQYQSALHKANQGLVVAPNYTDIRVLRVRTAQALKLLNIASSDIIHLLKDKKDSLYKSLIIKQLHLFKTKDSFVNFSNSLKPFYNTNPSIQLNIAENFTRFHDQKKARNIIQNLKKNQLTEKELYHLNSIDKKLRNKTVAINHETLSFMSDFPVQKTWNTTQINYTHALSNCTIIGSITNSFRFYDTGTLFEIGGYTTFTPKIYTYINLGFSSKENFYQNIGIDFSLFYTLFKSVEVELGSKHLNFGTETFTSTILGSTFYTGNFYINLRGFIGPEIKNEKVQNYQATVRYYLPSGEDYMFARVGTGLSPDETHQFTQLIANPKLNSYFGLIGATKWFKHYNVSASLGYQYQELSNNRIGNQFIGTIGLKHRF